MKGIPVAPVLDSTPETNETFTLQIFSPLGKADILGSPTMVSITILPNDDFNGVFSFTSSSLSPVIGMATLILCHCNLYVMSVCPCAADEPLSPGSVGSVQSSASFVVQRTAGAFGPALVYWLVESVQNDTTDIAPLQGTIEFEDGARSNTFQISALPDQVSMTLWLENVVYTL